MADLTPAHRGYEYQDLMAACRLVDVVLGRAISVRVDEKLFFGDRFDDLTTVVADGGRQRAQFKHTDDDDKPLTLATFTGDGRDLRLDLLVAAAAADRDRPGSAAAWTEFRVVVRDSRPVDARLLAVLRPADPDPGPFQPGMRTFRMRFDADALWNTPPAEDGKPPPFAFLSDGDRAVARADLDWLCERLVVEVEAPKASWDLTAPGPAEALLLHRLRAEVGAESYPNQHRSAADVAYGFVGLARVARQGSAAVTRDELLRRAQLRHDYGAVARAHPVDPAVAIGRGAAVAAVAAAAAAASAGGGAVVVTAPPGHGKSWLCEQLVSRLDDDGWLVAEHYCYLGDADGDRIARVLAESLFGSLLARVADADPGAVAEQRPLLAASEDTLVAAVARAVERSPVRPVALIVDGLDHVTRVRQDARGADASYAIAEALAALELPPGGALIVLSQPGGHLEPLLDRSAVEVAVPGLSRPELEALAAALGVPGADGGQQDDAAAGTVNALEERSAGNALYATYLCREVLRDPAGPVDPAASVLRMPPFDGTLAGYYEHLWSSLEQQAWWVADVIALIDFAVTRDELREIRPGAAHRVGPALDALAPVLVERSAQGGVRVYHESLGRFLRQRLQADADALAAVLGSVADWLDARGLFDDPRAFRSLIPVLAQAGRHADAVALVGEDFVVRAIAAALPVSAIQDCLATAASSAAAVGDWAAAVRCVELARAAATMQDERFGSTLVAFADVVAALVGTDAVSGRLLHDGRPVMAARAGLQMCAAVDELGGVPPWREYLAAHRAEDDDTTSYGDQSDRAVDLAWLRGRLRLSAASGGPAPGPGTAPAHGPPSADDNFAAPVNWQAVTEFYDDGVWSPADAVRVLADTYGDDAADGFACLPENVGPYCLAMAEAVAAGQLTGSSCTARTWAWAAVAHGLPDGSLPRLVAAGLDPGDDAAAPYDRDAMLSLTRAVQDRSVRWEGDVLPRWLDQRAAAASSDPVGLDAAEALISGPGWYPCWLRFAVALARAETVPPADRDRALHGALALLADDLDPFTGDPRACDLYPVHGHIRAAVRRAVAQIADPDAWERAVALVREVGDAIATSLTGELGGPLPSDWLMDLTIGTAPPSKLATARALARAEAEQSAARRFYSDIAEAALFAARTELACGDRDEAKALWTQACRLLVAYGWHKDITVYELLDPFPALVKADPRRARERLPALQGICERAWLHTDGKETRGAPARWWKLLAAADPAALAGLIAADVHASCNDPDDPLHDALAELWRAWNGTANPFVAAALRLSIRPPLDQADPGAIGRLAQTAADPRSGPGRLLAACLARADERPDRYAYNNSRDMTAADAKVVEAIAAAALQAAPDAPAPLPLPALAGPAPRDDPYVRPAPPAPPDLAARLGTLIGPAFPSGPVGLARAVRGWQSRPYDDASDRWAKDTAANVLGYRLLETAQSGRRDEASAALLQIADGTGLGRDTGLLAALAEGFAARGENRLAAEAGALAWTRARGHGGWLTFGGQTQLDALRTATSTDAQAALATVGYEISRAIRSGRGGTWGISQALVLAFAAGAASPGTASAVDAAFACFDAALEVIDSRTPRVHPDDDPDLPYRPPSPDQGHEPPGDLDAALASAAVAGISRPEREAKRRALLSAALLVQERPALVAAGVRTALGSQSDPATLGWLLAMLTGASGPDSPALASSADELAALAAGPHLAVRAAARALLRPEPPMPPPDPADPELTAAGPATALSLWTPAATEPDDDDRAAPALVHDVAGNRLRAAERLLPGLTAAVVRRTATARKDPAVRQRVRRQVQALADRHGGQMRWPDAWLALAEAIEDAVQRVAAGARFADLRLGVLRDPAAREAELADRIADPPGLALALESRRGPRPAVPPPPSRHDPAWDALGAPVGGYLGATLDAHVVTAFDDLDDAGGGWRVLASAETLVSPAPYADKEPDVIACRFRAVEVRLKHDRAGLAVPPFAAGDLRDWGRNPPVAAALSGSQPLAGVDLDPGADTDSGQGLGLPESVVSPGPSLLACLRAAAADDPFELDDDQGPLLALRTWRTLYETSDYHQPWPRLTGSALVITRRGFDRLASAAPRLVLRDYVDRRERGPSDA